jgi:hypothetical protein
MKTKKDKKSVILERMVENLRAFYPELDQHFMCPTCLAVFPVSERSRISEAHIVPRAAGGSLKTYICTACNSKFGAHQDRWLGEYLQLRRQFRASSKATILDSPSKPGYFAIDGTRVQGTFRTEDDGSLGFYIYHDKTAPEALRRVLSSPPKSLTIPVPLLGKQDLVNVGFLTAAYLLWFKELGYSWVLQAHLDQVRQQIQSPSDRILEGKFWVVCPGEFFEHPWVGVTSIRDELVLIAALAERVVLLPPADRKNVYSILDEQFEGLTAQYHRLRFSDGHHFGTPVGVIYRDRLLISPDVFLKEAGKGTYILYPPGDEARPRLLFAITKDQYESQRTLPNNQLIEIKGQIVIPIKGTGEPER